jgi:transitional endoplasmic reticulum ATPase
LNTFLSEPLVDLLSDAQLPDIAPQPDSRYGQQAPTDYDDLCRHWILRVLIDLGGHRECLHQSHCSQPNMLAFAGVYVKYAGAKRSYSRDETLEALEQRYEALGAKPLPWPEKAQLVVNLRALQQQVGLSDVETQILLLCVLARNNHPLNQALEGLGSLSNLQLFSIVATLLGVTSDVIGTALSPQSSLTRSCLAKLDNNAHYTFEGKIDLLSGIAEGLLENHGGHLGLFKNNFVPAPAPRLTLENFAHLQPRLGYLVSYLRDCLETRRVGVNILIFGLTGTGKTELARALAAHLLAQLFEVATSRGDGERIQGGQRLSASVLSQRILGTQPWRLGLFDELEDVDHAISSDDDDDHFSRPSRRGGSKAWFNQRLESNPMPMLWVSNRVRHIDPAHLRRFDMCLHMPVPPVPVRAALLSEHAAPLGASSQWTERAARHEGLGPAMIERVARVAAPILRQQPEVGAEPVLDALLASSLKLLGEAARPQAGTRTALEFDPALVCTRYDIPELIENLQVSPHARMCFYGVSGTGKSALAAHIAKALGRPLLLKRGSDLIGSFVGESERSVADAFEEAREKQAVLVIDEADSFLSTRQEAKRSWEITLVNEFLQQIEAFDEGVFIATTNLMDRLDEALLRRFDAKVAFDYLQPPQAVEMMRRTCIALGVYEPGCEEMAAGVPKLAPGDFALVMRQARFRPVRDAADIRQRLIDEVVRKSGSRPIGFGAVLN